LSQTEFGAPIQHHRRALAASVGRREKKNSFHRRENSTSMSNALDYIVSQS